MPAGIYKEYDFKVGEKYGKWKLINKPDKRGGWLCECECGLIQKVKPSVLLAKNRGCRNCAYNNSIKIINGNKYGKWEAIEEDKIKHRFKQWICRCKCGNISSIQVYALYYGKSLGCKQCGCSVRPSHHKSKLFKGYGEISNWTFNLYKKGAEKRKIAWNLTIEYLWNLFIKQKRKCALSGVKINFQPSAKKYIKATASLDRIDSSKDYTEDNVQWVHKQVNFMKQAMTDTELINWCRTILNYNKNKVKNG